jgi:threonine synthase
MKLYSTHDREFDTTFKTAVFQSLPPDGGLYMPVVIPALDPAFINGISGLSFREIAWEVARTLLEGEIEASALRRIVDETLEFDAPLVRLEPKVAVLELFHGPSMAFKDFGARFMSRVMAWYLEKEQKDIHILVATSGDTGGAVAMGFYDVPHIRVTILYPSGKVSPVQEKQLTTLGKNIAAIEVKGTFDDCQKLVKQAFLDPELNRTLNLSSANSINIARLIPQSFYYFHAYAQLRRAGESGEVVFSVPSGNFGNLTAGLIAWKMGLPVHRFIASTNINDEVPEYLRTGRFTPRPSSHTLSNAMDVGNPSNFTRMLEIFGQDAGAMNRMISGYSFTDAETKEAIEKVAGETGYVMCPHTAIAWAGLHRYLDENPAGNVTGVFLSTAHPCKFPDIYEGKTRELLQYPERAGSLEKKEKKALLMENDFGALKHVLLSGL